LIEEIAILREQCRKLEELSFVDALTGLYNFRYMQRALEVEMERTRRSKLSTGLIMIDLDHFKNVNTLYGHESGNTVLAWAGKIIKDSVRVIDVPCRYGGEEFALILPGASLRQSMAIAQRLMETLRGNPVILKDASLTITASLGVAVFTYGDESSSGEFLDKCDQLLYKAKELGRDRVCSEDSCPIVMPDEVTAEEKAELFSPMEEDE
jgi:diguanylate cyclase (GGDEF)-like protein